MPNPPLDSEALQELREIEVEPEELRPKDDDDLAKLLELQHEAARSFSAVDTEEKVDGYGYYYADRNYRQYTRSDSRSATSRMVSRDVAEAVDDMMPNLLRVVLSNDYIVEFEAASHDAAPYTEAATAGVNDVLRNQEDFRDQLEDFIKEGLVVEHGIFEVVVIEPRQIPESVRGVQPDALAFYARDPSVQLAVDEVREDGTLNITLLHGEPRHFRVESHPDSDLLVSPDATSLDQYTPEGPSYVCLVKRMTVGSAIAQWPDKAGEWVRAAVAGDFAHDSDGGLTRELEERRGDELPADQDDSNLYAKQITVLREYYRADMDGDGWPELLQILRVGRVIVGREPVMDNPFASWTPYRVPHSWRGESQRAKAQDIQDYKTGFWRIANDSAAMAAMVRYAINEEMASKRPAIPMLSDLLRFEPGSPVRTPGPPKDMIAPLQTQDVTDPAMKALAYADQTKEGWTGQSRRQRGLDPEAVANESGVKYDKLLSAGNGRMEFIARNLATGIERMAIKLLRHMVRYGPEMTVPINGVWTRIDPAEWHGKMRPIVHISGATGSIDLEVQYGLLLLQQQYQFMQTNGQLNPWVGPEQIANSLRELAQSIGYRDHERFVRRPKPEEVGQYTQGLMQQKDPKVEIEEIKADVEHARMQSEGLKDKYRLDIDRDLGLLDQRVKARIAAAREKGEDKRQDKELAYKRWETGQQKDIAKMQAETQAKAARQGGSGGNSGSD